MDCQRARSILSLWNGLEDGVATLINLSENHTFRIDLPDGGRVVLRVHRPRYHSREAIESELAWMDALRGQAGLFTPRAIAGRNGARVQEAPFTGRDDARHMVLFAFEAGAEPRPGGTLEPLFGELGALAARCHAHVEGWTAPAGFVRQAWSAEAILDVDGIWGDWRRAPHVTGQVWSRLDRLDGALRERLGAYGTGTDRFGLIHADMRLANLLVGDGATRVIDFDDCGFGWFGYDFAAAVSFMEDSATVPGLRAAWLEGYREHRPFSAEDEAMLDALVLLRRMALLAWIGSHGETELAREHEERFAPVTVALAERLGLI